MTQPPPQLPSVCNAPEVLLRMASELGQGAERYHFDVALVG